MRFSNILLALDSDTGNALALQSAIQLARNESAKLTVCEVVDSIPRNYRRLITSITPREVSNAVVAARLNDIETMIWSECGSDMPIDAKVLMGREHIEIARLVREENYDLVIKPVTGRRALRSFSNSRKCRELIRHCPCPVWLVNISNLTDKNCVVAALDMPEDGAVCAPLNDQILRAARSIALATFRPLHIVHTWTLTGEGHLRARATTAESNTEIDRMVAREAARRMEWLQKAVYEATSESDRLAINYLAPELHAIKGNASKVLPQFAEELGAGLIVMGSAGRTGLKGMLIGNTSEALVFRSECSVLIVKHPGSFPTRSSSAEEVLKLQSPGKEGNEPRFNDWAPTPGEAKRRFG